MDSETGFMRPPQAARYIGLAISTLAKMRLRGDGPVFVKAGPKLVLYCKADIDAWIDECRRQSTSDDRGAE